MMEHLGGRFGKVFFFICVKKEGESIPIFDYISIFG